MTTAAEIQPETLDARWLAAHPLPSLGAGTDKNSRGRVLVAGGTALVPGALRLTARRPACRRRQAPDGYAGQRRDDARLVWCPRRR